MKRKTEKTVFLIVALLLLMQLVFTIKVNSYQEEQPMQEKPIQGEESVQGEQIIPVEGNEEIQRKLQEAEQNDWIDKYYNSDGVKTEELIMDYDETKEVVSQEGITQDKGIITLTYYNDNQRQGFYHRDVLKVRAGIEDEAAFITRIVEEIRPYVKHGFEQIYSGEKKQGYIETGKWGKELEPFYGRDISNYTSRPLILPMENVTYRIKMDTSAKEWVHTKLMPEIQKMVEEESMIYPIYEFKFEFPTGTILVDFDNLPLLTPEEIEKQKEEEVLRKQYQERAKQKEEEELGETTEVVETSTDVDDTKYQNIEKYNSTVIKTFYPITGLQDSVDIIDKQRSELESTRSSSQIKEQEESDIQKYNVTQVITNSGNSYGFSINEDYMKVLRGYWGETYSYSPVEIQNPETGETMKGCASTVAYIATIKNLSEIDPENRQNADYNFIKNNPAVDLKTKTLVDAEALTPGESIKDLTDIGLDPLKLVIVNTQSGTLLVQTEYHETIKLGGYTYTTGEILDLIPFYKDKNTNLEFKSGRAYNLNEYIFDGGKVNITAKYRNDIETNPFWQIEINKDNANWARLVDWAFNRYSARNDKKLMGELEMFIKDELDQRGKLSEYDSYLEQAGQMTEKTQNTLPIIITGIVILLVLIIIILVRVRIRKKKKQQLLLDDSIYIDDINIDERNENPDIEDFNVF